MLSDPVRLFWRPLREGEGTGEAPPWRITHPVTVECARDDLEWLARDGRWLARIEPPPGTGTPRAFVVRERVEELPAPWWRVSGAPPAADWIDACEGDSDVADVMHAASFHVERDVLLRAAIAACETRMGDIRRAADRRVVTAHMGIVHGEMPDASRLADRAERGIAALGAIATRLQWVEFQPNRSKSAVQHAKRAETAVRAFAQTFWLRFKASRELTPKNADMLGEGAERCLRYVQNPYDVRSARKSEQQEPAARAAARRAVLSVLGDRLYTAVADGVVNHGRTMPVETP